MALCRVQSASSTSTTGSTLNVTLPTGSLLGYLVIASIQSRTTDWVMTNQTGIVQNTVSIETSTNLKVVYRILDATDISNNYLSFAGTADNVIVALALITGNDFNTIFGTPVTNTNSGSSVALSTITFGTTNDLVITTASSAQSDETLSCSAADGGATVFEWIENRGPSNQTIIGLCDITRETAGSTGSVTWTRSFTGLAMAGISFLVNANTDTSPRYWVGGTGTWDPTSFSGVNWSTTSGGSAGATPPTGITTQVFFDANSGGGTVTLSTSYSGATITCSGFTGTFTQSDTLTLSGNLTLGSAMTYTVSDTLTIAGNLTFGASTTFAGSSALSLGGNLTVTSGSTLTYTGPITFTSTSAGKTITSGTKTILSTLTFDGVSGGWTLQDSLTVTGASITLTNGSLNLGNQNVSVPTFVSSNSNIRSLTMGSGTITLTGTGTVWNVATSANLALSANTSTIKFTDTSASAKTFSGSSLTYNNFWITGAGSGEYTIVGSNTFNDFKVDTPPHTVNFTAETTQTFQTFTVNGTVGNLIILQSTIEDSTWYLFKSTAGNVVCDYLSLKDSYISGI